MILYQLGIINILLIQFNYSNILGFVYILLLYRYIIFNSING